MDAVVTAEPAAAEHSVQFYEDPEALIDSATFFLYRGLAVGDAGVVIARESHRRQIEDRLRARGFELSRAHAEGRYVAVDAADTMGRIMEGGWPEDESFDRVVGELVAGASRSAPSGRARVFGEIVALPWDDGKSAAAIRVEQLWNRLATTLPFSLHCGYPMAAFGSDAAGKPFLDVCAEHARVVPSESFTRLAAETERGLAVALLQQKARSLEAELARRDEATRSRNELLAMLQHELRNPLSTIVMALELARRQDADAETIQRSLEIIERQTRRLTRLVEDLLVRLSAGDR